MTHDSNMIHRLAAEDKEIILIGTAHVSRESVLLVEAVIADEKPDTVCIELCSSRYQALRQKDRWRDMDIIKVIKDKKAFLLLSNLLLASFQKRIARKMDVQPGAEMLKAVECADAVGAGICLADRDIRTTLSRAWHSMGWWSRVKLLSQLLLAMGQTDDITEADIERMKQQDVLEALLSEVGQSMPALKAILIDERDQYLAEKIRRSPGRKTVAVVGAGHVPGIKAHWGAAVDLPALEQLPPPGRWAVILKWGIPGSIVALFAAGFFYGGSQAGQDMILLWSLCTGVLAGLGAAAGLRPSGHHRFIGHRRTVHDTAPLDRRGLDLRAGGGLLPQAQGEGSGEPAGRHPLGPRFLAQQRDPHSAGRRLRQSRGLHRNTGRLPDHRAGAGGRDAVKSFGFDLNVP